MKKETSSYEKIYALDVMDRWKEAHTGRLQNFSQYESAMDILLKELKEYGAQYHATKN